MYAVTDEHADVPAMTGIDGGRLHRLAADGLAAIVSETAARADASEAAVLAHAAVVDALAETAEAVLPARFGGGFDGAAAVVAAVAERREQLGQALERVRGCVELGVRVLASDTNVAPAPPPDAPSGRTYMLARLDRVRAAERVATELDRSLVALAHASTSNVVATEPLVVTAAYLVPRGDVDTFRARVDGFHRDRPELTLICTGPWPPYSFATVEAEAR